MREMIELKTGLPGFPCLWILGDVWNFGVFGFSNFNFSVIRFCFSIFLLSDFCLLLDLFFCCRSESSISCCWTFSSKLLLLFVSVCWLPEARPSVAGCYFLFVCFYWSFWVFLTRSVFQKMIRFESCFW